MSRTGFDLAATTHRVVPLCLLALPAISAAAGSLPQGFQQLPTNRGSVMVARIPGSTSATKVAHSALDGLASAFDGKRPRVVVAAEYGSDRHVQALFEATVRKEPVHGLMVSIVGKRDALVGLLWDQPSKFAGSLPEMTGVFKQFMQKWDPSTAPVTFHPVRSGTETISLPDGWQVTDGGPGMIDAKGPQGEVHFGFNAPVYSPQMVRKGFPRPPLVAPYGDAARAVAELLPQLNQGHGLPAVQVLKVWGQAPLAVGTLPGTLLDYELEVAGRGKLRTLAWVHMRRFTPGAWGFYISGVASDVNSFGDNLPVLMQIWSSWKTDPSVFQARMGEALRHMQETNRLWEEANAYRQETMEKAAQGWDEIIRQHWPIENATTGEHKDIPIDDPLWKNLPPGWKKAPLKDLQVPEFQSP